MPEKAHGIVGRFKQRLSDFRIEREREAAIGMYTLIYYTYKKSGNKTVPELCKKIVKALKDKSIKEPTEEIEMLNQQIIYEMKKSPGNIKKRFERKFNKLMAKGGNLSEEEIEEMLKE